MIGKKETGKASGAGRRRKGKRDSDVMCIYIYQLPKVDAIIMHH